MMPESQAKIIEMLTEFMGVGHGVFRRAKFFGWLYG